ncbi:hypothetical protein HA052_16065 [Chromobacterium haemolyticum]|uniref:Transcription factor LuxR-like autoinducer-binding domain-containing protein n=1 Tax=Chromobacterium fluminis TaxID=3044269 RepID=A0ABX0LE74_9NEIS|nr:autoinducer binding domain-containing protein [Chromobacterium haemolyticum]NHR06705.1 hypothetical protein [Chromobacterium haemolyticum]OQS36819.1 hypothetical protein B0T40_10560 [Chromobacterium haemolyticum]
MQITLSNLPEAIELFRNRAGAAVHDTAVLRRLLIRVKTKDDLAAALSLVRVTTGGAPLILVAFFGDDGFDEGMHINLGWPASWLEQYAAARYDTVDPVALGPSGIVFPWSPLLLGMRPKTQLEERFHRGVVASGLTHGLSYKAAWPDCRLILSLIGEDVETQRPARELLEILMPDFADVAYRVFASNRLLAKMTVNQRMIINLILNQGLTQRQAALQLNMSLNGLRYSLDQLKAEYGCTTMEQLMFKLGAGENS